MSMGSVESVVQTGAVIQAEKSFLSKLPVAEDVDSLDGNQGSVEAVCDVGPFRPTVTWDIDTSGLANEVTETVRFGWRWVLAALVGSTLVVAGETLGWHSIVASTDSLAVTALGGGVLASTYAVAARYEYLESKVFVNPSRRNGLAGGALIGGPCLLVALVATGPVSVAAAVGLSGVVVLTVTGRARGAFDRTADSLARRLPVVPRVPTRHAVYSILAALGLWVSVGSVVQLKLARPTVVWAAGGVALVVTVALLGYIPTPIRARVHAFGAGVVSGVYVVVVVASLAVESRVTGPPEAAWPSMLALGVGVTLLWWAVWWIGVVNPRRIKSEFTAAGRQVSTHTAALFAYLSIMGSGLLVLSGIVFTVVQWRVVADGHGAWVGLVGVPLALPLAYFVVGSGYQLTNVVRLAIVFNRHAEPIDPDRLPVAIPYPVKTIPSEVLYSGDTGDEAQEQDGSGGESERRGGIFGTAYADPFGQAIVLTEYTVEELSETELEAILKHEQSHFEYRGAERQFQFATLPAFVLMGKNVVYSVYDFFRRELTADQYAYVALRERGVETASESLVSVFKRYRREEAITIEETRLGFFPTMLSVPDRQTVGTWTERWFELFYGNFAGSVHPDTGTRWSAVEYANDIPLEESSDPEERARLIARRLNADAEDE